MGNHRKPASNFPSTRWTLVNLARDLDPETRRAALVKLDAVVQKIGYPDKWESYEGLDLGRDSLFENTTQHTLTSVFGASVELENQDDGGAVKYQIVGEDEADIRAGRISITSPIARALVGKSEGDVVDVDAPGGVKSFEVVSVHYE